MNSISETPFIQQYTTRINYFLRETIKKTSTNSSRLQEAVNYSLLSGGKRIRPILVYSIAEMTGVQLKSADHLAASIEMIHAYSLIHDDLPSMDDDDLRRGEATCHIKFDEATAILAGDALQAMAFEVLSKTPEDSLKVVKLIPLLAQACGLTGMAGGQSLDLIAEQKECDLTELENIHRLKTGALLSACVKMTLVIATKLTAVQKQNLTFFADQFGIAFQITDDIIDITSDTKILGKPSGSDTSKNKSTYPKLLGLTGAKNKAEEHINNAKQALKHTQLNCADVLLLTELLLNRKK